MFPDNDNLGQHEDTLYYDEADEANTDFLEADEPVLLTELAKDLEAGS